jgi:hypothetical protein
MLESPSKAALPATKIVITRYVCIVLPKCLLCMKNLRTPLVLRQFGRARYEGVDVAEGKLQLLQPTSDIDHPRAGEI